MIITAKTKIPPYARFGVKGETQITSELTGFGQFEYNLDASKPEGSNQEKPV